MKFPSPSDLTPFDADSPFDRRAEETMKRVVDLLVEVNPDDSEDIGAALCGALVGVVSYGFCCFEEKHHREVYGFLAAYMPQAASLARGAMDLPPFADV